MYCGHPSVLVMMFMMHLLCVCVCSQHRQEAQGIGCDVVRVEIDESLSKEHLLEIFINCGKSLFHQAALYRGVTYISGDDVGKGAEEEDIRPLETRSMNKNLGFP